MSRYIDKITNEAVSFKNTAYFGYPEWLILKMLQQAADKNVVVISANLYQAQKLYEQYEEQASFVGVDDFLSSQMLATKDPLIEDRMNQLNQFLVERPKRIFTHLSAMTKKMIAPKTLKQETKQIRVGEELERDAFAQMLVESGYTRKVLVEVKGDFALRGGIIDVFPFNHPSPIRIELFDTEVDTLRIFDEGTQITKEHIQTIDILPASDTYIQDGLLIDYFSTDTVYIFHEYNRIQDAQIHLQNDVVKIEEIAKEKGHHFTPQFIDFAELEAKMKFVGYVAMMRHTVSSEVSIQEQSILTQLLQTTKSGVIKQLQQLFESSQRIYFDISELQFQQKFPELKYRDTDVFDAQLNIAGVTFLDEDVYVSLKRFTPKKEIKRTYQTEERPRLSKLSDISEGDYIVHEQYGIGKYHGLKSLPNKGAIVDYIEIEYAKEERLYLTVDKIVELTKYVGKESFKPKLSRLGTSEWQNTKKKVNEALFILAQNLQMLYQEREQVQGIAHKAEEIQLQQFYDDFPYSETPDQLAAIYAIKNDMERIRPMDRLVCGDVGFGKTEIAFRAAYQAILAGKQVALLSPTTILTAQHYETAQERFSNTAVMICQLSRFVSVNMQKDTIKGLSDGSVDFVIGTHRLLSQDVVFKDLGLLIVDEEHRFGVEDKEKLKLLKNKIDVLSLSATPIPRTMQMSLSSVIDVSFLETPPKNRYPIQTYVMEENPSVIREAIERELARDGQVFYLFNRVRGIEAKVKQLEKMLPHAKIQFAHGQMSKNELEDIMDAFHHREFDVLVATTIIENGIDIPNANTLLVSDAQNLGLSQMYQLRGRVGRSDRLAYAYFFYPYQKVMNEKAEKRLQTMKSFTELGSGFKIAMQDLFLRGAGDLFSGQQSGFMQSIGFELYSKFLDFNMKKVSNQVETKQEQTPKITDVNIQVDAYIPQSYISDEALRIEAYQKLNELVTKDDFTTYGNQLIDRFGLLPESVVNLIQLTQIKVDAQMLHIQKISEEPHSIKVQTYRTLSNQLDAVTLKMIKNALPYRINVYENVGRKIFEIEKSKQMLTHMQVIQFLHVIQTQIEVKTNAN
ncbi:MAG: transcription-repair coupling factor [Culicoidibacterales bacterium]